jgi:hypothetical protein
VKLLAATVGSLALLAPAAYSATSGSADVVDVNRDGYYDAGVREKGAQSPYAPIFSWLHDYDVGAKCTQLYSRDNDTWYFTLTIRPPAVWPTTRSRRQPVAWRGVWRDSSNRVLHTGTWISGKARSRSRAAEFGGRDLSNIYDNDYYSGSEWYTYASDSSNPTTPWIQVAWWRAATHSWRKAYMRVNWVAVVYGYSRGGVVHSC